MRGSTSRLRRWAITDNRESTRKRIVLLIIASAFSILIVAENVPHAAHSLLTIFSSPPEPQTSLIVGAYVFLPLALLWVSWAYLRKGKRPLVSFPVAACAIFLTMDYLLAYPGPVKKTFLMIDEGRKIFEVGLENSGDAQFLTKQGNPIGISLNYTMSMPAGVCGRQISNPNPSVSHYSPIDAGRRGDRSNWFSCGGPDGTG
jgi:hypothetical protein